MYSVLFYRVIVQNCAVIHVCEVISKMYTALPVEALESFDPGVLSEYCTVCLDHFFLWYVSLSVLV